MPKGILIQNGVHLEKHEYETVKILLNHGFNIELIPPSRIKNLRMPEENAMKEIERYFTFSKRIKHIMIIQKSQIIIDMIK